MLDQQIKEPEQTPAERINQFFVTLTEKIGNPWLIEVGVAALVSIAISILFGVFAQGGANSSDITLYLNLGMNGIKMPFVLNRYFHIFLQQIFVALAPSPLAGYHAFWGFIVGMTVFLIYISARKALKSSNVFHGILAVLFFFSMTPLAETAGVIVVDMTAMMMVAALFAIYVFSLDKEHKNHFLVAALGFVLYLAFKTKETTLPAAVLLFGLAWVGDERLDWRGFAKNLLWVGVGVLSSVVFFAILSGFILGDPLFGLRISEWQEFTGTYAVYSSRVLDTLNALEDGNTDDWYQGYWFAFTLLPFVLYLISGALVGRKTTIPRKMMWVVPLAFVVLMILSINNRLGYELRFGLPILSVLCALAPQFITIDLPDDGAKKVRFLLLLFAGLVAAFGIRLMMQVLIPAQNWDLGSVVNLVYYPLLLTLLFFSIFFFQGNRIWGLANFLIILSLLISPIFSNYRLMFVSRPNQAAFQEVIRPLAEFGEVIEFFPEMQFYATDSAFTKTNLRMVKDEVELFNLFNVYFDASSTRDNFVYVETPRDVYTDLVDGQYDFALMGAEHWDNVVRYSENLDFVLDRYQVHTGASGLFVLLTLQN